MDPHHAQIEAGEKEQEKEQGNIFCKEFDRSLMYSLL